MLRLEFKRKFGLKLYLVDFGDLAPMAYWIFNVISNFLFNFQGDGSSGESSDSELSNRETNIKRKRGKYIDLLHSFQATLLHTPQPRFNYTLHSEESAIMFFHLHVFIRNLWSELRLEFLIFQQNEAESFLYCSCREIFLLPIFAADSYKLALLSDCKYKWSLLGKNDGKYIVILFFICTNRLVF